MNYLKQQTNKVDIVVKMMMMMMTRWNQKFKVRRKNFNQKKNIENSLGGKQPKSKKKIIKHYEAKSCERHNDENTRESTRIWIRMKFCVEQQQQQQLIQLRRSNQQKKITNILYSILIFLVFSVVFCCWRSYSMMELICLKKQSKQTKSLLIHSPKLFFIFFKKTIVFF